MSETKSIDVNIAYDVTNIESFFFPEYLLIKFTVNVGLFTLVLKSPILRSRKTLDRNEKHCSWSFRFSSRLLWDWFDRLGSYLACERKRTSANTKKHKRALTFMINHEWASASTNEHRRTQISTKGACAIMKYELAVVNTNNHGRARTSSGEHERYCGNDTASFC
jgi:hypothetical protein